MNPVLTPTLTVVVKASGHVCVIDKADFDATLHTVAAPRTATTAPPAPPADVPLLAGLNAKDAIALIEASTSANELLAFHQEEAAHPRFIGGRASVLDAITRRQAALPPA
jgi:hypothetical protein